MIVANAALFTLRGTVDFAFSACGCVCCSILISCDPNTSCPSSLLKIRAFGSAHFSCASFSAAMIGSVSGLMLMTQIPFGSSKCILLVWFVVVKCMMCVVFCCLFSVVCSGRDPTHDWQCSAGLMRNSCVGI